MDKYNLDQKNKVWDQATFPERELRIGIYGFGYLGQQIGIALKNLGFDVCGYSKSKKLVEGIKTYELQEEEEFLSKINVLVGVLPMTPDTYGIFSQERFNKLKEPTYFINIGRGNQQVEKDIVSAIEKGKLTGAMLDVFMEEPLVKSSELWENPNITITPHIAGITNPDAAVPQIYENYKRLLAGEELIYQVDYDKGY